MTRLDIFKSDRKIPTFNRKTYLTLFSIFTIFIFFSYSCSKENTEVSDQVNKLTESLKSQNPNCKCEPYLSQYLWRNETVYVLGYKGPACDWFPIFYNSDGREFTLQVGYTYEKFIQESTFIRNVWSCK